MIPIERPAESLVLDERTRKYLSRRQAKANGYAIRSENIDQAWSGFLVTKAREKVSAALDAYSHAKCAYCEQVAAKDIEHFYPKADHPARMFLWTNFLRGCKNCNNAKRDKFPLDGGRALLIDPCGEEPMDFFLWDFKTGKVVLNPNEPHRTRAEVTRDLLDLDQEPLREERRAKVRSVLFVLAHVVEEEPIKIRTIEQLRDELHPGRPWLGIVRQLFRKPNPHSRLVEKARRKLPEIEGWIADWI